MSEVILGGLAALLYLVAGAVVAVRLSRGGRATGQDGRPMLLALGVLAILLHGALLSRTLVLPDGFNLGFFHALSLTGWLIAVVLVVATAVKPVENLGIVLLPFAAVTVLMSLGFSSTRIVSDVSTWQLETHIMLSILAYSFLALAAVQSLLLAIQNYRLRHGQPGGFVRGIPPLVAMEHLLFQLIVLGFGLLTLALASGFVFLEDIFAQHLVHKTVLSLAAWGVFAILLWGRRYRGWRGRIAIRWTLAGFAVLMIAYFGSKMVLELILGKQW